jgi:hypothetical protein
MFSRLAQGEEEQSIDIEGGEDDIDGFSLLLDSDHLPKGVKRTLVRTFHP